MVLIPLFKCANLSLGVQIRVTDTLKASRYISKAPAMLAMKNVHGHAYHVLAATTVVVIQSFKRAFLCL